MANDDNDTTVATEFVTEAFETKLADGAVESLATIVENVVRELRTNVESDDRLEDLLRGEDVLRGRDSIEQEDPEPLTKRLVIEPLFRELGYPDLSVEAGDFAEKRGQQADYSISLREVDSVESERLLVEAEPLNKKLDQERHGIGQVKDWLGKRQFDSDFGIATDGLRWVLLRYDPDTYSFDTLADVNLQPLFVAAFENLTGRRASLSAWLDDEDLLADFLRVFQYDNFLSIAGDAREVIKEKRREITDEFYDDYVRLVFGIVTDEDETRPRSLIGEGVVAPESASVDDVRLFAVELMNRLVFIKFLEDKELVDPDLLVKLKRAHEEGTHPPRFYKAYLEPLFFDILDERPGQRTDRIQGLDIYEVVPYLNGGLFRPASENGHSFDETEFDVRDSVLLSIVDLLESYSFSADGGPTDLDPSVLGNVFEKTINHITGDAGDQKKELGAYYTPDEITRFCAEQTVQPALLERFADRMVEQWGWTEEMADEYDDVYDLIDALPATNTDVIDDLLNIVDHFRALDPACGSGHFLTSVQSEIVAIRKTLYEKHDADPQTWELHKETVVENVYGVDIVSPAVEIAKLRLWLSIIAEVNPEEVADYDEDELALPNVVFNVRQGNSLIGFTDLMETSGDGEQSQLSAWGPDSVREKYEDIIELVGKHKAANETEEALTYLHEAETLLEEYRVDLDEKVLEEFHEAGIEDTSLEQVRDYEPFHWVLEFAQVYADGGFDVIVANPPWDVLSPSRDDFFSRYDKQFRTRMPDEKDAKQKQILEEKEGAAEAWEEYLRQMEVQADYFNSSSAYELQTPTVAGNIVASENDLSALFLERIFVLAGDTGKAGLVLPGFIISGAIAKDLRMKMLNETQLDVLIGFENHGIFSDLHHQYTFGVFVFENSGSTDELSGIFQQHDVDILTEIDEKAVSIPKKVLAEYSPEARIFPSITTRTEVDVLNKIIEYPPLSEGVDGTWWGKPLTKELHEPTDKHRFVESPEEGDYPVYGGGNVHQFHYDNSIDTGIEPPRFWSVDESNPDVSAKYRIREKRYNHGDLKKAIYTAFDGDDTSKSQKQFVDDLLADHRDNPLSKEDVLLDCTEYRVAYRDIARSSDERTMISAVLPKDTVCVHTLQTLRPYDIDLDEEDLENYPMHSAYERIFTDQELFVAVGLLNSLPFDFLMRTKIDTHIVKYKFEESQMPRLTEGDEWFEYIWTRAARLNCYGEPFAEMRERLGGIEPATDPDERQRLQAEIDAAAFHAYGLNREETKFVLDDFHRVQNPRTMTDEYFDLVLAKYDELAS